MCHRRLDVESAWQSHPSRSSRRCPLRAPAFAGGKAGATPCPPTCTSPSAVFTTRRSSRAARSCGSGRPTKTRPTRRGASSRRVGWTCAASSTATCRAAPRSTSSSPTADCATAVLERAGITACSMDYRGPRIEQAHYLVGSGVKPALASAGRTQRADSSLVRVAEGRARARRLVTGQCRVGGACLLRASGQGGSREIRVRPPRRGESAEKSGAEA